MTKHNRIVIETGTKKVFASAIDWPGWSRSGKTEEDALNALVAYAGRYRAVADIERIHGVNATAREFDVIERVAGNGATDFGVPDHPAKCEDEPMTDAECERQVTLLKACWAYFDDVASRVSEELRKGPRGGGRDRDGIVKHAFEAERSYVRQIRVKTPKGAMDTETGLREHRAAVCLAIREMKASGEKPRSWPLRYFIRRAAWHVLDHAWEMEDKNLA